MAVSASRYQASPQQAYAVVQYANSSGRIAAAVGMFTDCLSAEQYAIDHDFPSYDVVPATVVTRRP